MMFNFQHLPDSQPKVVRTSKLWWLGFGMKLMFFTNEFTVRKGWKQRTFLYSAVHYVTIDRRFFRGTTLVIRCNYEKPVYFKMTKRQARKAKQYIDAQITHHSTAHLS